MIVGKTFELVDECHGLAKLQIVQDHNRETSAFQFHGVSVEDFLFERKTLVSNPSDARSGCNAVVCLYLGNELSLYLRHDNGCAFPINVMAVLSQSTSLQTLAK